MADQGDHLPVGYLQVEAIQSAMPASTISKTDIFEANGILDRKSGVHGRARKDLRSQLQEFVQVLDEEQTAVDFSGAFKESPQQRLGLLEGLKAEQQVPQPRFSGQGALQHPS